MYVSYLISMGCIACLAVCLVCLSRLLQNTDGLLSFFFFFSTEGGKREREEPNRVCVYTILFSFFLFFFWIQSSRTPSGPVFIHSIISFMSRRQTPHDALNLTRHLGDQRSHAVLAVNGAAALDADPEANAVRLRVQRDVDEDVVVGEVGRVEQVDGRRASRQGVRRAKVRRDADGEEREERLWFVVISCGGSGRGCSSGCLVPEEVDPCVEEAG